MIKSNTIVVTGGRGRFAQSLKKIKSKYRFIYPHKNKLDITKLKSIVSFLKKTKPKSVLHLAGLSRPMSMHDEKIIKSINLNIIGTSNVVVACSKLKIKLIYFSTSYIYPGKKGGYSEKSPLLPLNNYSWSKLGGEAAVQMYKNSLILRIAMSERPWIHPEAFINVKTNFLYHDEVIKILPKILDKKGIINIGGNDKSIYNFAKKTNPKVKKSLYSNQLSKVKMQKDSSININKLKKIIKI